MTIAGQGEMAGARIGDSVFIEIEKNTPTWVPGTILNVEEDQLQAKLDGDIAQTCGIDRQTVWVPVDKVVAADRR